MNKSYEADVARLLKLYEEVETDPENEESSDYDSDAGRLSGTKEEVPVPSENKRGRCKYCKDRKTKYYCKLCNSYLCLQHVVVFCCECSEKKM